jgi:hypothetical protein
MPNQYSGSFEHKIQERFSCTAKELLERLSNENLSYFEAEKRIGITHGTIRKWARRYGIKLKAAANSNHQDDFRQHFFANELNVYNFLSRDWLKVS